MMEFYDNLLVDMLFDEKQRLMVGLYGCSNGVKMCVLVANVEH